jgi:hypothetical protein
LIQGRGQIFVVFKESRHLWDSSNRLYKGHGAGWSVEGLKWSDLEANHSLLFSAEVNCCGERYLQISIRFRDVRETFTCTILCLFIYNKKQLNALISQIYFGMKLYMFRTVRLTIIGSLFTVHSAMVYVIQVCIQLSSRTKMELANQFHPDDRQTNCPKHVEFHAKINL